MPREECRKYNEDGRNRGGFIRYKEVTGGKCQWGTVLNEVCVALIVFHPSRELEKEWEMSSKDERRWVEVKQKHVLDEGSALGVTTKGTTWLGKKVNVKGVEMNKGAEVVLDIG